MTGYQTVRPPLKLPNISACLCVVAVTTWQHEFVIPLKHISKYQWLWAWPGHFETSKLWEHCCVNKLTKCVLFHKMLHCTCTAESWRQLSGYGGQGQPQMSSLLGFAQQYAKDQLAELGHRINNLHRGRCLTTAQVKAPPCPPWVLVPRNGKAHKQNSRTCSHYLERCCSAAKLLVSQEFKSDIVVR